MPDPTPVTGDTSIGAIVHDRDGNTSSKRVAGLTSLANVLGLLWYCTIWGKAADPVMVVAAWTFTFGCFAMTLPEWWFGTPKT